MGDLGGPWPTVVLYSDGRSLADPWTGTINPLEIHEKPIGVPIPMGVPWANAMTPWEG